MALTQISTQGIKDGTITGSDLATNVDLVDNQKLRLGTGNDLQIYHDGSNSYLADVGTGNMNINGSAVQILNPSATEVLAKFIQNAAVELYYDNSKKFETTSSGGSVSGNLTLTSTNPKLFLVDTDNDSDYQVSNNNGVFTIKDTTNNVDRITILPNGGISFNAGTDTSGISISNTGSPSLGHLFIYGDNGLIRFRNNSNTYTAKIGYNEGGNTLFFNNEEAGTELSVIADGAKLIDNKKFICGYDNDLQIYHDGSNSYLQDSGTGHLIITTSHLQVKNSGNSELIAKFIEDGAVELYYDHQKKFETTIAGVTVTGDLTTGQLFIGDGGPGTTDDNICIGDSKDLKIYHDGNSVLYDNGTGNFILYSNGGAIKLQKDTGENMGIFNTDGAVELYHDNSKKFETTSGGVDVTGALTVNGAAIGGGGKVIQVLRTTASMSSTSSGSFQATGLSQAITMTNSANKILAIATGGFNNASAGAGGGASIFRGTANLAHSNDLMASFFGEDDSNNIEYTATFTALDTPGAGTHTYTVQLRAFSGTMRFAYRNTGVLTLIELDYS